VIFLDHTQRRNTFGSTPLDQWSALSRKICLAKFSPHNGQIFHAAAGFEPTISAGERPQT